MDGKINAPQRSLEGGGARGRKGEKGNEEWKGREGRGERGGCCGKQGLLEGVLGRQVGWQHPWLSPAPEVWDLLPTWRTTGNAKLLPAAHHGARAQLCQEPPSGWCLPMPSPAPAALMKGPNLCHGVPPAATLLVSMETPPSSPYGDSPGTHSQKKSTSLLGENSLLPCFSLKMPAEIP